MINKKKKFEWHHPSSFLLVLIALFEVLLLLPIFMLFTYEDLNMNKIESIIFITIIFLLIWLFISSIFQITNLEKAFLNIRFEKMVEIIENILNNMELEYLKNEKVKDQYLHKISSQCLFEIHGKKRFYIKILIQPKDIIWVGIFKISRRDYKLVFKIAQEIDIQFKNLN